MQRVFPELFFSFLPLVEINKKKGNIKQAFRVMKKELEMNNLISGKNSFQKSICLWIYGNLKFNLELGNEKTIELEEIIDLESFLEIIKIYNSYLNEIKSVSIAKEIFAKISLLQKNFEFLECFYENHQDKCSEIRKAHVELMANISKLDEKNFSDNNISDFLKFAYEIYYYLVKKGLYGNN